jgi:hypothetical protein
MSIKEQVLEIIDSVHPDEAIAGVSIEFVRWLKHKIQAIPDEVTLREFNINDRVYYIEKWMKDTEDKEWVVSAKIEKICVIYDLDNGDALEQEELFKTSDEVTKAIRGK